VDWTEQAIVLAARKHGEGSAIVELLTPHLGRHAGLVRGASRPAMRGILQPGNSVQASWKARLAEHLGTLTMEMTEARAALIMTRPEALLALSSLCALAVAVLPEREPHRDVYEATGHVLDLLSHEEMTPIDIGQTLVRWEIGLLGSLGFGLDLSACAVTGEVDNLIYVSPRSGRAVSQEGAGEYAARLLVLPPFLMDGDPQEVTTEQVQDGFRLSGHFIELMLLQPHQQSLPPARERYLQHLAD